MHRPSGLSALFRVSLTILLLLLVSQTSRAQGTGLTVQNQFVAAEVEPATGILSVRDIGPNGKPRFYLTNAGHSYLSISINGRWYTNNNAGGQNLVGGLNGAGSPVTPIPIDGCTTTIITDASHPNGMIRTTYDDNSHAFSIVQEFYPVAFRASGQIVYSVKIVNHSQSAISVEGVQWMNDIQANTNDNPYLLERNYYDGNHWRVAAKDGTNPTPPSFYVEFEHDPVGLNLGSIGAGFTNDSFPPEPMGLTPCSGFAAGSWQIPQPNQMLDWLYGCPAPPSPNTTNDMAVVLQWTPKSVPSAPAGHDTTIEEFRTSFGTQEFCMCLGNAISINVFPTHLKYDQISRSYTPNPFNVLSMVFDIQGNAFTSLTAKHNVIAPIHIIGGTTGVKIAADSLSASYSGFTISPGQMHDFYWRDSTYPNKNCNGAGGYFDMGFDITASGYGGSWECTQPGNHNGSCDVLVDCADVDTIAPIISAPGHKAVSGVYIDTFFTVTDNGPKDFGLHYPIVPTWSGGATPANFPVTITPSNFSDCTKQPVIIDVQQKDSTIGGCVNFVFLDCANNPRPYSVCFDARPPQVLPDTVAPKFYNRGYDTQNVPLHISTGCTSTTNYRFSKWVVIDTAAKWHNPKFGHGIKSVVPINNSNTTVKIQPFGAAPDSVLFSVDVNDTMHDADVCIVATDTAGNKDTMCIHYCTVPDTTAPKVVYIQPTGAHSRFIHVADSLPWDRGIDTISIYKGTNVKGIPSDVIVVGCKDTAGIDVTAEDPNQLSCFQIRVVDCAHNVFTSGVICMGQDTDVNCPKIVVTQNPGDLTHVHVTVIDSTNQFEQGIDSVWFKDVKNMKLTPLDPPNTVEAHCPGDPATTFNTIHGVRTGKPRPTFQQSVSFDLEICDTNNIDVNQACVTINAIDGANHLACSPYTWCVPLTVDSLPPLMFDSAVSCSSVTFVASDSRINDRGLAGFSLKNTVNLAPFDLNGLQGSDLSAKTMVRNVIAKGKSAYGELFAVDAFGAKQADPAVQAAHSASGKFWLYAQDLVMKASHVFLGAGNYDVKILLDKNDSIKSLARKNIWELQFNFHLDGDPNIQFVSAKPGPFAPNWNVTVTPTGANHYSLTATGPALPDMTANEDVLLLLTFHANSSDNTGATKIVLDPVACGNDSYAITYNGGADTGVAFINTTMTMHAPFGNMNGGVLTIKGNCTPFASTDGAPPTAISMSPIQPNPAWKGTPSLHVMYTIADEGLVKINLYNSLGEKVRCVTNESQKQGEYQIDVPSSDLPEGMYFLRLEAGGLMITRRVVLGGE